MIIPITNMISISLPRENIAVGLGMNTMLRNLGGAIGPVLATTIMATYTSPYIVNIGGHPVVAAMVANSTAFNTIFAIAIAVTIVIIFLSLTIKNYTFSKSKQENPKSSQT
jgi:hypothetical protein